MLKYPINIKSLFSNESAHALLMYVILAIKDGVHALI